jgi:hypothetical protein
MSAAPEDDKKDGDGHGEADAKPKGSKLPLIFAIVNTVGLLGLAGFVVLSKGKEDPKDGKGKGAHAIASPPQRPRNTGTKPPDTVRPPTATGRARPPPRPTAKPPPVRPR